MSAITRRLLFSGAGIGLVSALAGCGADPRIIPPTATITELPSWRANIVILLRQAAALSEAQSTPWTAGLAAGFTDHANRLAGANPLAGVQGDFTPLPYPSDFPTPALATELAEVAGKIAATAQAQIQELATTDADATSTGLALLLSSVELVARLVATTDLGQLVPPVAGEAVPAPLNLTVSTCWEELISATDSLVFSLGAMLGHTTDAGQAAVLADQLGQAQREQELIISLAAEHDVQWLSNPDPVLQFDPAAASNQAALLGSLELAVMTAWVRVYALAAESGMTEALAHGQRAMSHGSAINFWPGWL